MAFFSTHWYVAAVICVLSTSVGHLPHWPRVFNQNEVHMHALFFVNDPFVYCRVVSSLAVLCIVLDVSFFGGKEGASCDGSLSSFVCFLLDF